MTTDVHQSVNPERTATDIPRHTEGAQASGSTTGPLSRSVGRKSDILSQKMGTSCAETELPLSLSAQVSEKKSGILLRIQREETGIRKTDLSDL